MIENEELGLKVAENKSEALIVETIEQFEKAVVKDELNLELDQVILAHLKAKKEALDGSSKS
jgi:hypothetical protein